MKLSFMTKQLGQGLRFVLTISCLLVLDYYRHRDFENAYEYVYFLDFEVNRSFSYDVLLSSSGIRGGIFISVYN